MSRKHPGRTYLENGNSFSRFTIFPPNWETPRADTNVKWYLIYRYYEASGKMKQRMIAGNVNQTDSLSERQQRMRELFLTERERLLRGQNPLYAKQVGAAGVKKLKQDPDFPIPTTYHPIEPDDTLKNAVLKALWNPPGCEKHKGDLRRNVIRVLKAAAVLGYGDLPISTISKKHMTRVFIKLTELEPAMSNELYNRIRTHLLSVFNIIENEEANERRPVAAVPVKPTMERKQEALTLDEIKRILVYLKGVNYHFYRFAYIFYHTASRPVELCRLQYEDVNLNEGVYRIRILKKKKWREEIKPIHVNVLHLWKEVMNEAKPGQYLFAHGYKPGEKPYASATYSHTFKNLVKEGLGITRNFYTLKHRKLDEIRVFMLSNEGVRLSREITQHAASHDSFKTTSLYLNDEEARMNTVLRHVQSHI